MKLYYEKLRVVKRWKYSKHRSSKNTHVTGHVCVGHSVWETAEPAAMSIR